MLAYVLRRIALMIPMLFVISAISFTVIQLPPGDFLTTLQAAVAASGGGMSNETVELLRQQYGLDQPLYVQYFRWISGFPRGDFGYSFEWNTPVWPLVSGRLGYTIMLGVLSLIFMFGVAVPIGIYSATHQYSLSDNLLTGITFVGLAIPGFLLALIYLFVGGVVLRLPIGGTLSPEFRDAPWSIAKALDYGAHLLVPALILGLDGTAQMVRIMRSNTLESLGKQYVTTARAKGLPERVVVNKYAVRPALNPLVSVLALEIPKIINASILVGVVLSLPTTGPLFLRSLLSQDMYLAGTFLLLMATMLLVANLLADIALAWLDPEDLLLMIDVQKQSQELRDSYLQLDAGAVAAEAERVVATDDAQYGASQWQLIWLRFTRNRAAMVGGVVVLIFYMVAAFGNFLVPYTLDTRLTKYLYLPPQPIHLFDGGRFSPFVYGITSEFDDRLRRIYTVDTSQKIPVRFFAEGEPYKLLGLIPATRHLFVADEGGIVSLLGTDRQGRDMLTRAVLGSQISLTVGLTGVMLSLVFGSVLGVASGYYGGVVDNAIQRLIELVRSFPSIPLWMALAAALPATWPPLRTYFAVTIILSLIGWTWLARQLRGMVLSLRQEDYVMAAKLAGAGDARIIFRHLIPASLGQIIVVSTLAMPAMILAETSLSFLGLGLRPPLTSWGVLLQEAQNLESLVLYPWVFAPAVFIVIVVLAFSFLGDGLRDAADPYTV